MDHTNGAVGNGGSVGSVVGGGAHVCFCLTHHGVEGAPMRWQRLCASLRDRYLTSSAAEAAATEEVSEPGTA